MIKRRLAVPPAVICLLMASLTVSGCDTKDDTPRTGTVPLTVDLKTCLKFAEDTPNALVRTNLASICNAYYKRTDMNRDALLCQFKEWTARRHEDVKVTTDFVVNSGVSKCGTALKDPRAYP
jgi:hypothetical protein